MRRDECAHGVPFDEDCEACNALNRESDAAPERDEDDDHRRMRDAR